MTHGSRGTRQQPGRSPCLPRRDALAALLGADVEAVHVRTNGEHGARAVADAAGLALTTAGGPVVERSSELAAAERRRVALVIGARATPGGAPAGWAHRARGRDARCQAGAGRPTGSRTGAGCERVLVPLEGSVSSSLAPRRARSSSRAGRSVDVVALHVHDEDSIPSLHRSAAARAAGVDAGVPRPLLPLGHRSGPVRDPRRALGGARSASPRSGADLSRSAGRRSSPEGGRASSAPCSSGRTFRLPSSRSWSRPGRRTPRSAGRAAISTCPRIDRVDPDVLHRPQCAATAVPTPRRERESSAAWLRPLRSGRVTPRTPARSRDPSPRPPRRGT